MIDFRQLLSVKPAPTLLI